MGIFIEDVIISFNLATKNEHRILNLKFKELTLEQKTLDFKIFKQNLRFNSIRKENAITKYFNPFMNSKHTDLKDGIINYFHKKR
ncbi:MAG: hypothetical protein B6229_02470 [Spirochaetaceae bacterium 4572_7]|nr:MAG: hypothetical protein B6229_02470 [Spirochaetaceae bacterium 4572_7]